MINYMKSEVYRNINSKGNYMFLFGGMAFAIFLNVALGMYANSQVNFPYGNTHFSFSSMYSSMSVVMILSLPLVSIVYGQEFNHNTLKNSISYGIGRNQIYFVKFLMEIIISLINLICISSIYILSAYIMLENSGVEDLNMIIRSIVACIPLLVVGMAAAHCLYFIFEHETTAAVVWVGVMIIIPQLLSMAGRRIVLLGKISKWMPWSIMGSVRFDESTQKLILHWSSKEGFIQCFIVGVVGILIFYILGLTLFKKREIK